MSLWDRAKNMLERLPRWYRDDNLMKTVNDEVEGTKLLTYYKMLCSYPIQPIQVWKETNLEPREWSDTLTQSDTVTLGTGSIEFSPEIEIEFKIGDSEAEKAPIQDIVLTCENQNFVIEGSFYVGDTIQIIPGRGVIHNNESIPFYMLTSDATPLFKYNEYLRCTTEIGFEFTPTDYTSSIDVAITQEKYPVSNDLFGRFWTEEQFPFKRITFYDDEGTVLRDYSYKSYQDPPVYFMDSIESTQIEKFYVSVQYHGLLGEIRVGFPQLVQPRIWKKNFIESGYLDLDSDALGATLSYQLTIGSGIEGDHNYPIEGVLLKSGTDELNIENNLYPGDIIEINEDNGVLLNNYPILDTYELDGSQRIEIEFTPTDYTPSIEIEVYQDDYSSDPKYGINSVLDDVAETFGLTRRKYKPNLTPVDSPKTYPPYYLYDIEQDFYLENRILAEYFYREEVSESMVINKEEDTLFIVYQREYGSRLIEGTWYTDGLTPPKQHFVVTSYEPNRDTRTEIYSELTIQALVDEINSESKLISAEFVKEDTLDDGNGTISLPGIFEQYGGLASEIYQNLGCIPYTIDITEYLLKWNIDKWAQGKLWGGDIYLPGTYYLEIPVANIPANFELLTMDEINSIVEKYRMLGTRVFPEYVVDSAVQFDIEIECLHPYYFIEKTVNIPPFKVEVTDSLSKVCMRPSVRAEVNVEKVVDYLTTGGALLFPSKVPSTVIDATPSFPFDTLQVLTEDGEFVNTKETVVAGVRTSIECVTEDGEEVIPTMTQTVPSVAWIDPCLATYENYEDWDFVTIWKFDYGSTGYPKLRWEDE